MIQVRRVTSEILWFHPPDGGEAYVFRTRDGAILIDTGLAKFQDELLAAMQEEGIEPDTLRLAFASHFHCDHVGGMGWWRDRYGIPVAAHEQAVEPMRVGDRVRTGASLPYAGFDEPFLPCTVDRALRGGETFTFGGHAFDVAIAPGHSVSGIHIVCGETVFVGDNLFETGGIGWMDVHWGSNPEDYLRTLEHLRRHTGKLALAGHGKPYVLRDDIIDKAVAAARFHVLPEHGLGRPRAPSQYPDACQGGQPEARGGDGLPTR